MHIAVQAIGEGVLGAQRAAMAAFTIGLLLTFLGVRTNTRLIRAKVSWWFHDIESEGGVHVHHMVIGVILMVTAGLSLIAFLPSGLWLQLCALVFGAGVALTLDEFALILRLQDVYWTEQGRLSVDAVIVAVCAGLLFVLGFNPFVGESAVGTAGPAAASIVAVEILVNLCFAVICMFKGKLWTGFFGVFIPFVAIVGAIRLARPQSPWARRRYGKHPNRLAKAQRREDRMNRTWRAWRTAFFDLIAGKPHLPNLEGPAPAAQGEVEAPAAPGEPAQGDRASDREPAASDGTPARDEMAAGDETPAREGTAPGPQITDGPG